MRGVWFTGIAALLLAGSSILAQRQGGVGTVPTVPLPSPSSRTTGYPGIGGMPTDPMDPSPSPDILLNARIAEQQARTRNSERQKRLESDTQKLVGLVDELKQQMQGEKQLSPSELSKRVEEIEKLARSVKDRMRG